MKTAYSSRRVFTAIAASGLAAALFGFGAGCASRGYEKGASAAQSLAESSQAIQTTGTRLDATLAALNDLVNNPRADLRPQYETFSTSVDQLGASAKQVQNSVTSMAGKSKEYLAAWEKELDTIGNAAIRGQSEAKKQQVAEAFAKVKRQYAETEIAFRPLMTDLRDIQKALGANLTAQSVGAMKNPVALATTHGAKLQESVNGLLGEFKSLGLSMSPTTPK